MRGRKCCQDELALPELSTSCLNLCHVSQLLLCLSASPSSVFGWEDCAQTPFSPMMQIASSCVGVLFSTELMVKKFLLSTQA